MVVSNDFDRKVTGYNIYEMPSAWFMAIPINAVVTLAAGPGEILGIMIVKTTGTSANYNNITIHILIDGQYMYLGLLRDLVLGHLEYNFQGQFGSNSVSPYGYVTTSFRLKLTYDSSAAVAIVPTPGTNDGFLIVHARHGG